MSVFEDLGTAFGNDERSKNTFRMRTSHPFSSTSQIEYSRTMHVLMTILYYILLKRATVPNISYILRALEILNKLAQSQVVALPFISANMTLIDFFMVFGRTMCCSSTTARMRCLTRWWNYCIRVINATCHIHMSRRPQEILTFATGRWMCCSP